MNNPQQKWTWCDRQKAWKQVWMHLETHPFRETPALPPNKEKAA